MSQASALFFFLLTLNADVSPVTDGRQLHGIEITSTQRILIDVGGTANYGGTITASPSISGNYWNNMTDARPGVQLSNAVTSANLATSVSVEVINRLDGTYNTASLGIGSGNTAGDVGDYPSSATTDHALIHSSATNGRWRISGFNPAKTYTVKFWGTRTNTTAPRFAEIKRSTETEWKFYNATQNNNYDNAAVFAFSSLTEVDFDIRTRAGSDFSAINVIEIQYDAEQAPPTANLAPVARAGSDSTIQPPVDSLALRGCSSFDPENAPMLYKWRIASGTPAVIIHDTACLARAKNLLPGDYQFELTVTDTAGAIGKDTVAVHVNPLLVNSWPPQYPAMCNDAYKIVVVGSSTAYGTGSNPLDSSWVRKYKTYITQQNPQATVVNLAVAGFSSWDVQPTGTVVPFPFSVDTARNITKALSLNPDAIIINLPSNDVARGIPTDSIHKNFERIVAAATAQGVPVWVTSTQPRNGLSAAERILQMELRDWVNVSYGNKAVDFWTTVALPTGEVNPVYGVADGVHLNNYGHHLLFTRTVAENIWDSICVRRNLATSVHTMHVNIFGGQNAVTNSAWNNWNRNASLTSNPLFFDNRKLTNIYASLQYQDELIDNGTNYVPGATAPSAEVLRYNSAYNGNRTLTIAGLNKAKKYNITLYASRAGGTGSTVFAAGTRVAAIPVGNNGAITAMLQNLVPDKEGKIIIKISGTATINFFAGFSLTEF